MLNLSFQNHQHLEQYQYRETDTRYECIDKPNGFDELSPLEFHSPYGCSKGGADLAEPVNGLDIGGDDQIYFGGECLRWPVLTLRR